MKKITKLIKRSLAIMLCVLGFVVVSKGIEVKASTDEVINMYNTQSTYIYHGGVETTIFIELENISYEKDVYVKYKFSGMEDFVDKEAEYLSTQPNGKEIWAVNLSGCGELLYSLYYTVTGVTYYDDNNSNMYTFADVVGIAPLRVNALNSTSGNEYRISVSLKNIAYEKDVKVRYTTDNWNTYQDKSLEYIRTEDNGLELWRNDISLELGDIEDFEYAVSYTVNGQTYWENNFGRNFNESYYGEY